MDLDIELYNTAIELQHKKDNKLNHKLAVCDQCGRKYSICCICPEAEERWESMLDNVKQVQKDKHIQCPIETLKTDSKNKKYTEQDMLDFSWYMYKNLGRTTDDKSAHFQGFYLKDWTLNKF